MMTNRIHLRSRAFAYGLMALALLVFSGSALATTTLQHVSYKTLPGGRVQLSLTFSGGAVPQPRIFTTTQPPTIAVDFANTTNAVAKHHIDIGVGATTGVTVVSAGGRTRMVVELLRPSSYRSQVHGNTLTMVVDNGNGSITGTAAATIDPTKQLPTSAGSAVVSRIGFRRGPKGEGRVLIHYAGTGLQSQVSQSSNGNVIVRLDDVRVPNKLAKRLDVTDFATPVQSIDTRPGATGGATVTLTVSGSVVTSTYKNGNQLVIAVAKKAKKENANLIGATKKKVYSGRRVTFNFQSISVRAALQLLAEISHLNIVASDAVNGSVTLHLTNVPWDQALEVILRAKGLGKRVNGNVMWIAPQAQIAKYEEQRATAREKAANSVPLVTAYIPISYGSASAIAKLLTSGARGGNGGGGSSGGNRNRGFLSPRGSVSFDQRTNTLLINDTPEKIKQIKNLVAVLDRPVRQVLIEARIVAATTDFARNLGLEWGVQATHTTSGGNVITTGPSLDDTTGQSATLGAGGYNVNLPIATKAGNLAVSILGANYLVGLELQASQTEGRTEIISNPRVITANQQTADIQQGQQIGYVTYGGGGGSGIQTPTVRFKNAVLELKVTPTITADQRVFMQILVKKDALTKFVQSPGGGQVPLLSHRQLTTRVLVDNGQTVVLGGIYEINKNNNVAKVPWLGDIPILGALFRQTSKGNSKAELLIFVTPRILTETGRQE